MSPSAKTIRSSTSASERAVAGVRQEVENGDMVARMPLEPVANEVRADESGPAGDEEAHEGMTLARSCEPIIKRCPGTIVRPSHASLPLSIARLRPDRGRPSPAAARADLPPGAKRCVAAAAGTARLPLQRPRVGPRRRDEPVGRLGLRDDATRTSRSSPTTTRARRSGRRANVDPRPARRSEEDVEDLVRRPRSRSPTATAPRTPSPPGRVARARA